MTDFTSSLYLGMKHGSRELKGWEQLTTGTPAILNEPAAAKRVANEVARMQGLESGFTAPSTLHLYTDLYDWLAGKKVVLFIDEKIYPVSSYGIEKILLRGIRVIKFRHQEAEHLHGLVKTYTASSVMPVIVTDGWCPVCGKAAPVYRYTEIAKRYNGLVVLDDTQAFGLLGEGRNDTLPYGKGGGGLLKWQQLIGTNIVTIVSLAKAFGAPMSVISGPSHFIHDVKENSKTRVHSSTVSAAHVQAALHALHTNRQRGDWLRKKLWRMICLLKQKLKTGGSVSTGGIFPVQHMQFRESAQTFRLSNLLNESGIATVLLSLHGENKPAVSFIIRSDHTEGEIALLAEIIRRTSLQKVY